LVLLREKSLRASWHLPLSDELQEARLLAGDQHSHVHELLRLRIRAETQDRIIAGGLCGIHGRVQNVAGSVNGSSSTEITLSTSSCTGKLSSPSTYSQSSGSSEKMARTPARAARRRGSIRSRNPSGHFRNIPPKTCAPKKRSRLKSS